VFLSEPPGFQLFLPSSRKPHVHQVVLIAIVFNDVRKPGTCSCERRRLLAVRIHSRLHWECHLLSHLAWRCAHTTQLDLFSELVSFLAECCAFHVTSTTSARETSSFNKLARNNYMTLMVFDWSMPPPGVKSPTGFILAQWCAQIWLQLLLATLIIATGEVLSWVPPLALRPFEDCNCKQGAKQGRRTKAHV
jgi:hypothetical protein